MKSKDRTVRVERRTLADGRVAEYRYAPRTRQGSVAYVIGLWQNSVEWDALRPRTQDNYVAYIDPFYAAMKHVQVASVRRKNLMAIRDEVARKSGHGAALTFCRAVSAFFTWALEAEHVEVSPATRLATKLKRGHWPAWRDDQAQRAMAELPEPFRRAVVLAYYTGQRRGDLCTMRWADYDGTVIRLTQEKTDEPMVLPVHPRLKAELEAWKIERRSLTILEHRGRPWDVKYLTQRLPQHLERIGLPRGLNMHGLRRLAAVRLAEAGCTPHEIGAITGHRTLAMVQEYTRGVRQRGLADIAILRLAEKPRLDE